MIMRSEDIIGEKVFSKQGKYFSEEEGPFGVLHQIMPLRLLWLLGVIEERRLKERSGVADKGDVGSFKDVSAVSSGLDEALTHSSGAQQTDDMFLNAEDPWRCEIPAISLEGVRILDIGCGGGLMAEPLARLGAHVVGIDASSEALDVARARAKCQGLMIEYRGGLLEDKVVKKGEVFDIVMAFEVIEHTMTPLNFLSQAAAHVKDWGVEKNTARKPQKGLQSGMLVLSTLDRTFSSYIKAICVAESVGWVPCGAHDWKAFLAPQEVVLMAKILGFSILSYRGLHYAPFSRASWKLSDKRSTNFFLSFVKEKRHP